MFRKPVHFKSKKRLITLVSVGFAVFVLPCLYQMFWLSVVLLSFWLGYALLRLKVFRDFDGFKRYGLMSIKTATAFMLIMALGIGLRLLVFEIYAIPSSSMESAIYPGDKIYMNKLAYGPQLPRSPMEVPWLNILYYLLSEKKEGWDQKIWDFRRLQGASKIKTGDVAVFLKSETDGTPYIKRCMGVPGDSLTIVDGVRVGYENENWSRQVRVPIQLWTDDIRGMRNRLDSLQISSRLNNGENVAGRPALRCIMSPFLAQDIQKWPMTDSLMIVPPINEFHSKYLAAIDSSWTIYNFGPLVIPGKGMKISLNETTFSCYKRMIEVFEGVDLRKEEGGYFIAGKEVTSYMFKENYYFMMGDNRGDSNDSRYGQMIPERSILGRADYILFSNRYGSFDWSRLMKRL